MESLRRQTFSSVLIILSVKNFCVLCQNVVSGGAAPPLPLLMEPKDYSVVNPGSTSPKLMNTLMNVAAAKGVLPELMSLLQSIPPENQQRQQIYQSVIQQPIAPDYTATPSGMTLPQTQTFTAVPQLSIVLPNSNCPSPPAPVPACYLPPGMTTPTFPTFTSPDLTAVPFLQPVLPQGLIPQNYPFVPQGIVKPTPVLSQQPLNQIEACLPLCPQPEGTPPSPNFQITTLPPVSPATSNSGTCTSTVTTGSQAGVVKDGQLPISLQINVPSPSIPAPRITIISAAPLSSPPDPFTSTPSFTGNYFQPYGMYPYQMPLPIVMERPRSKLRSWLPILLVALFSRDGGYWEGSGGCCNCCCPCNCGNTNIPIPYPIPIPTNNPIIMSNPYSRSPRKRGSRRDVYDDSEDD